MSMDSDDASAEVVDLSFPLSGGTLAEDHAWALASAVRALLPWFDEEPEAGILPLSGLAKGDGVRYIGGRARLVLRLPVRRVASADFLAGAKLDIDGVSIELGVPTTRPLQAARGVVYSHFIAVDTADEIEFLDRCRAALVMRGLQAQLITGKARTLQTPDGPVHGFSLMLHGLGPNQSINLQETGLGRHRALGCGIFVPHKSVAAVGE